MKFIVFIALLVGGWYVLRWFQQFEISRKPQQQGGNQRGGIAQRQATETIACTRCGTYVPAEFPTACDRTGCPFPGVG